MQCANRISDTLVISIASRIDIDSIQLAASVVRGKHSKFEWVIAHRYDFHFHSVVRKK